MIKALQKVFLCMIKALQKVFYIRSLFSSNRYSTAFRYRTPSAIVIEHLQYIEHLLQSLQHFPAIGILQHRQTLELLIYVFSISPVAERYKGISLYKRGVCIYSSTEGVLYMIKALQEVFFQLLQRSNKGCSRV
jgi:hypothetical protein